MSLLLFLGEFNFSLHGDNLQGLDRKTVARLAPQELLQRIAPVQGLAPGARTIGIDGLIRPEYQGGLGQIDALHDACDSLTPRVMTTGYGHHFGSFIIQSVSDKQSLFVVHGIPRKITFHIDLLRCPSDSAGFNLF